MHALSLHLRKALAVALVATTPGLCLAQAVDVTVAFDDSVLMEGGSTMLRVYGQVAPAVSNQADRIFSWYVDLLNGGAGVATAQYGSLAMPAADGFPQTSSTGTTDGFDRRGIHDTFMGLPGAGVAAPVELLAVPVTAASTGTATFSVQAGTTVSNLVHDFQVARQGGGAAFTGGAYTAASANLLVMGLVELSIRSVAPGPEISFTPPAGLDWTVQYRDVLNLGPDWADLPVGPHHLGVVTDTVPAAVHRFYRVEGSAP